MFDSIYYIPLYQKLINLIVNLLFFIAEAFPKHLALVIFESNDKNFIIFSESLFVLLSLKNQKNLKIF